MGKTLALKKMIFIHLFGILDYMKKSFRLQDIIDLEYFFHQDEGRSPAALHARDREIALSGNDNRDESPEAQLRNWLAKRQQQEFNSHARSPGEIFADVLRVLSFAIIATGVILGAVTGLAFFSYTGETPVNVFQFLLLFIAPQLFLIALLLCSGLAQKLLPSLRVPPFYTLFFERGFQRGLQWLQRRWLKDLQARKRSSMAHAFGIVKIHHSRYGALFYWPIFSLFQAFGLAFNLALLAVTLVKITTSDLAFGWQSTIQFTDTAVFQLVKTLALPWTWLLGDASFPDLFAIAGSRIILKEGIYALATADLTSWWPFLVMCLLVYGVITRGLFLFFGLWMGSRRKKHIPMDSPQCKTLLQRMGQPVVTMQAMAEPQLKESPAQKTITQGGSPSATTLPPGTPHQRQTTLIPQTVLVGIDIYAQLPDPETTLATELAAIGFSPETIQPFQVGYEEDRQLLETLQKRAVAQGVTILLEGWMVPLVSLLSYLQEIRARISPDETITLALVGRPEEHLFTPLKQSDFSMWQQKIGTLADPYIHIFPLAGAQE